MRGLARDLAGAPLRARGLSAFRDYLSAYVAAASFTALAAEALRLVDALAAVRYCMLIHDGCVTVRKYKSETDYSADVLRTFDKFKRDPAQDYRVTYRADPNMNHVEAEVLARVALLYPDVFGDLDAFCARYAAVADATITRFDREIQFYLAYLDQMRRLHSAGLPFCYPEVATDDKQINSADGFDLALALQPVVDQQSPVVCNDFELQRQGADHRGVRTEPGRQDNLRPHVRPAPLSRRPGLPGPRPGRSSSPLR